VKQLLQVTGEYGTSCGERLGLGDRETDDKARTLQQVAEVIEGINDTRTQSNIAASTAVLAGLVLDKELIKRLLRSDAMRESVIYQDILQEGELSLLMRLLRRKVGTVPPALLVQIQSLPLNQMEDLGEALLDFNGLADLEAWLAQNPG
jgi:predicted transposase YdaD